MSSSSSSRMGLSAEPLISKSTNAVGAKGESKDGLKSAFRSSWSFSPVEFNIFQISSRHLIPACVHTLGTYNWKYFVPHSMCSLLVRVTRTRGRWLFKNCSLWDNNKLQATIGNSWELTVISWTRSFTVRVTESGPNSTDHSIPSLETDNFMLL